MSQSSHAYQKVKDDWKFLLLDRSQVIVRHLPNYKPHGEKAIESFLQVVQHLSGEVVPIPVETFHVVGTQARQGDLRYVFKSPELSGKFVDCLRNADWRVLKVDNVVYVDRKSSSSRSDNSSVKVLMEFNGDGPKAERVLSQDTHDNHSIRWTCHESDPYKKVYDRMMDGSQTPLGGGSTPIQAWDIDGNDGAAMDKSPKSTKRKSAENPIGDLLSLSPVLPKQVKKDGDTLAPSGNTLIPSTVDEARVRMRELKDSIRVRFVANQKSQDKSIEKEIFQLNADKKRLNKMIEFYDQNAEFLEIDWTEVEEYVDAM